MFPQRPQEPSESDPSERGNPMPLIDPQDYPLEQIEESEEVFDERIDDEVASSAGFLGSYADSSSASDKESLNNMESQGQGQDYEVSPYPAPKFAVDPRHGMMPPPDLAASAAGSSTDRPGLLGGGSTNNNLTNLHRRTEARQLRMEASQAAERSMLMVSMKYINKDNEKKKLIKEFRPDATVEYLRQTFQKRLGNFAYVHYGNNEPLDPDLKVEELSSLVLYNYQVEQKQKAEEGTDVADENQVLGSFLQEEQEEEMVQEQEQEQGETLANQGFIFARIHRWGWSQVPSFDLKIPTQCSVKDLKVLIREWVATNGKAIPSEADLMIVFHAKIWGDDETVQDMKLKPMTSVYYAYSIKRSLALHLVPDPGFEIPAFDTLISSQEPIKEISLNLREFSNHCLGKKTKLPDQLAWSMSGQLLERGAKATTHGYELKHLDTIRVSQTIVQVSVKADWLTGEPVKFNVALKMPVDDLLEKICKKPWCDAGIRDLKLTLPHKNTLMEHHKLIGTYLKGGEVLLLTTTVAGGMGKRGASTGAASRASSAGAKAKDRSQRLLLLADDAKKALLEAKEPTTEKLKDMLLHFKEMMGMQEDSSFDEAIPANYIKEYIRCTDKTEDLEKILLELEAVEGKDAYLFGKAVTFAIVDDYKMAETEFLEFQALRTVQLNVMSYIYAAAAMVSDNGTHDNAMVKKLIMARKAEIDKDLKEKAKLQAEADERDRLRQQAEEYANQRFQEFVHQQQLQGGNPAAAAAAPADVVMGGMQG